MVDGSGTYFKEGRGPCDNRECHVYLGFLERERLKLERSPAATTPSRKCQEALLWILDQGGGTDCTRILLRATDIMAGCPDSFCLMYEKYRFWGVYGTLLGELIARDGKTHADVHSESLWLDLYDRFKKADWPLRASIIQCVQKVALQVQAIFIESDRHFNPFWDTVDMLRVSINNAVKINPQSPGLRRAIGAAVDLCYRLAQRGAALCALPEHQMPLQVEVSLAKIAADLLRWIVSADLPINPGLTNWHWTMGIIAQHTKSRRRREVQHVLSDIAGHLDQLREQERRASVRLRYDKMLGDLIPLLQDRGVADPRKVMRQGDEACQVTFRSGEGHAIGSVAGVIRNVDPYRLLGFCVEASDVQTQTTADKEVGLTRNYVDDFPCRAMEAIFAGSEGSVHVEDVELSFQYTIEDRPIPLSTTAKIVRAWPLPDRPGVGLAILAPMSMKGSLSPTWQEYLSQCRDAGRYQP